MDSTEVMIVSVTVNVCFVVVLIVSLMLRCRRSRSEEVSHLMGDQSDTEKDPCEAGEDDLRQINYPKSLYSVKVYLLTGVILSCFCFATGVYISTTSYVWQCPYVCHQPALANKSPSLPDLKTGHSAKIWYEFGVVPVTLLSAAYGCLIFTQLQLIFACFMFNLWSIWSLFRCLYLFANVVAFGVIMTTEENFIGATFILLMEIDAAIEGICQLTDLSRYPKHGRSARKLLSVIGCATSFGIRLAVIWMICVLLGYAQHFGALGTVSISVASFCLTFDQGFILLVIKQHVDRLKRLSPDEELQKNIDQMILERFQTKPGSAKKKDMAFHLINEGLLEMKSYARTAAGAIMSKKVTRVFDSIEKTKPESVLPVTFK